MFNEIPFYLCCDEVLLISEVIHSVVGFFLENTFTFQTMCFMEIYTI